MFKNIAMLALTASSVSAISRLRVNSNTRMLENEEGQTVILHGVNAVYKVPPYVPSNGDFDPNLSLNDYDIQKLQEWGLNFMRLGVMWEGVERTPGVYNDTYLGEVSDLIDRLGDAGIYVLIDAHQDVFARYMCGEGMPDFYAKEAIGDNPVCISEYADPILKPFMKKLGLCKSLHDKNDYDYSMDENDDPIVTDCQKVVFSDYFPSIENLNAFDALYKNKNGLQDKFVASWARVAQQFANHPAVIGFDPINEPYPGNNVANPTLNIPGKLDRVALAPMYERIHAEWKKVNPESVMYFEGTQMPDELGYFGGFVFPTGFQTPPGGEIGSNIHVFNDHTYCCQMGNKVCATGEPPAELAPECLAWHQKRVGTRSKDAERLGLPLIISEFGACLDSTACVTEIQQVTETCDDYLVGWGYWQYKPYGDLTTSAGTGSEGFYTTDGQLQVDKVKALARSYFMYTQGVPLNMSFRDNVFEGTYIAMSQNASPDASTVVYVGDLWYPNGGCTEVTEVSTGRQISADSNGVDMFVSGVEGGKRVNIRFADANGATYKVVVTPKTDDSCPAGHLDSSMPIA